MRGITRGWEFSAVGSFPGGSFPEDYFFCNLIQEIHAEKYIVYNWRKLELESFCTGNYARNICIADRNTKFGKDVCFDLLSDKKNMALLENRQLRKLAP